MDDGLADQDAIERVAVERRQPRRVKRRLLVHRKRQKPGGLTLVTYKTVCSAGASGDALCKKKGRPPWMRRPPIRSLYVPDAFIARALTNAYPRPFWLDVATFLYIFTAPAASPFRRIASAW